MPTISTTARRLRAYQATLDRLARPARPTTASRRCAPTGDDTLHALLTGSAYYGYHRYLTLAYFYMVIGSIDLLTSSDSPMYLHPSAVFYPVYLPDELCHLTTISEYLLLQDPTEHHTFRRLTVPEHCYLSWATPSCSVSTCAHTMTTPLLYQAVLDNYYKNSMTQVAFAPQKHLATTKSMPQPIPQAQ